MSKTNPPSCRFCNHEMFTFNKGECECQCHIVLRGLLEINDGDMQKTVVAMADTYGKMSTMPPDVDREITRLAQKAGSNADLTLLTDAEIRYLSAVTKILGIRKP